jgi:hypothetical protein
MPAYFFDSSALDNLRMSLSPRKLRCQHIDLLDVG